MKTQNKRISEINHNDIVLVFVPKGNFANGFNSDTMSIGYDYWIGKFEITNEQFYDFLVQAIEKNIVYVRDSSIYTTYVGDEIVPKGEYRVIDLGNIYFIKGTKLMLNQNYLTHPVVAVTWYGAMCFCKYYKLDLPTEAEWTKAAIGTSNYWFPWGNKIDSTYSNYYKSGDPFEPGTTPAGYFNGFNHNGFKTNNAVSYYGCYDMAGNAWEWTKDYWSKDVPYHTGKGGGFHYHTPAFLQVYYVSCYGPSISPSLDMNDIADGFRVVKRIKK